MITRTHWLEKLTEVERGESNPCIIPLYLSETWFFLLDCRFDILIKREEVGRIIPVLEGHQPFVVDSIGGSDPLFALVTQEVDIDPRASKRL